MHACADQASKDFGLFWIFVGLGNFCTVNLFGELSDVVGRKVRCWDEGEGMNEDEWLQKYARG